MIQETYPTTTNVTQVNTDANAFLLNTDPLDYRELKFDAFLSNLQGNILKGHGRDNTTHIFIKFLDGRRNDVISWIKNFTEQKVVCFKEQLRQRELFKRNDVPGGLFAGLYFTASLYSYLGLPLTSFANAQAFTNGMKTRSGVLNDDQNLWEDSYKGEIHAMILLAHDDAVVLGAEARKVLESLELLGDTANDISVIVEIEYGSAIRNANDDGLEHFGYVDGISQPLFLKDEVDAYRAANPDITFDPFAQLDLVLVPDPFETQDPTCFGSYFVYRKLEQDVRGFKTAERQVAKALGLQGDDAERAGAMIVGRFEDGTPLTLSPTDKMISSGIMNNFNYQESLGGKDDSLGARCPFHAHIRKANPRRSDDDKTHRMARRGISYGHRNVSTTIDQTFVQMPKNGVGLLFMSFQKSIENQFEFITQNWVNNEGFPAPGTGIDVEIGQGAGSRNGNYPKVYNNATTLQSVSFQNFVNLRGGEYFFAPSIKFLQELS